MKQLISNLPSFSEVVATLLIAAVYMLSLKQMGRSKSLSWPDKPSLHVHISTDKISEAVQLPVLAPRWVRLRWHKIDSSWINGKLCKSCVVGMLKSARCVLCSIWNKIKCPDNKNYWPWPCADQGSKVWIHVARLRCNTTKWGCRRFHISLQSRPRIWLFRIRGLGHIYLWWTWCTESDKLDPMAASIKWVPVRTLVWLMQQPRATLTDKKNIAFHQE